MIVSKNSILEVMNTIGTYLPSYRYDQYRLYPSAKINAWEDYLLKRLTNDLGNEECVFFFEKVDNLPFLLGCRMPAWDEEHFGFRMATINWNIYQNNDLSYKIIGKLLGNCLSFLRERNVEFVSTRISGDDLQAIHIFEENGFRYFETILYPLAKSRILQSDGDSNVRLMKQSDLEGILRIAEQFQFKRGHFYCDEKFNKKIVDSMYVKWVHTSFINNQPIAVILDKESIVGYFIFEIEEDLTSFTGYKYGRMTSLAMDESVRGKGFGSRFFEGTISLINQMGCQYIASEYATKNFLSARLHTNAMFYPMHEKVLLHLWL